MKRFNKILLGMAIVLFLPLAAGISFAREEVSMVSRELSRVGKNYYEQGNFQKAIHELSKALMVDSKNEEAKFYLAKMGIKSGLYGRQDPPLARVEEYAQKIMDYQDAIVLLKEETRRRDYINQVLKEEKQKLEDTINVKEEEKLFLEEQLDEAQESVQLEQAHLKNAEALTGEKREEILRLNTDLYDVKNRLVKQMDYVKEQKTNLKQLSRELKTQRRETRLAKLDFQNKLQEAQGNLKNYKYRSARKDIRQRKDIYSLRDALRKSLVESESAKAKGYVNDFKVSLLARSSLQKEKQIIELKQKLQQLDDDLFFYQSELKSQAIRKKFERDQTDKVALIRRQDQYIAGLKEKLVQARQEIQKAQVLIQEGRLEEVDTLEEMLTGLRLKLSAKDTDLIEKSKNSEILEQRLRDMKQRLKLIEQMLDFRDNQVQQMEEQLQQL